MVPGERLLDGVEDGGEFVVVEAAVVGVGDQHRERVGVLAAAGVGDQPASRSRRLWLYASARSPVPPAATWASIGVAGPSAR